MALPQARVIYECLHLLSRGRAAMDLVRRQDTRGNAPGVHKALGHNDHQTLQQLM